MTRKYRPLDWHRASGGNQERDKLPGYMLQQEPAEVQSGSMPPTITLVPKALYGVPEAAELLSLSPAFLRQLIMAGRIGSCKVGGRRVLSWGQVQAFVRSLEEGGEI